MDGSELPCLFTLDPHVSKKLEKAIRSSGGESQPGLAEKVKFEQSLRCLPADV